MEVTEGQICTVSPRTQRPRASNTIYITPAHMRASLSHIQRKLVLQVRPGQQVFELLQVQLVVSARVILPHRVQRDLCRQREAFVYVYQIACHLHSCHTPASCSTRSVQVEALN